MILRLVVVLSALLASPALAQPQAPAGNSHPQTQMLSLRGVVNPFGAPPPRGAPVMSAQQKWEFARALDLAPLRDLAVFHNGRIKILGSLAGETLNAISARRDYADVIDGRKRTYDPLFTFLDVIIDPSYYEDKALIAVNYLPMREALLRRALGPGDDTAAERERYKKLGRLTPPMVAKFDLAAQDLMEDTTQHSAGKVITDAVAELREALEVYLSSAGNLEMVSSGDPAKPWVLLSELPEGSPAGRAVRELGRAWRAGDAAAANSAVRTLAEVLPTINPETYPTTRRTIEALYNRVQPFEWGMWLYAAALVTLLLALGTHRAWLKWTGLTFLLSAVLLHAAGFAARCYIAERFAIQNQFESMTGVSLFAAIVGLVLAATKRQWLFGAAVAAVGFMILCGATLDIIPGKSINREAAILNTSVLLKYHVTTVLFSYGLISLGMIVSLFYLGVYYFGRRPSAATEMAADAVGRPGVATPAGASGASIGGGRAALLQDLDRAQMTILQLAFWALGVGILLGAWWADHSWGRWWGFDSKEVWALVTWLIYLVVVHVRVSGARNKPLITAWLSVSGFAMMLWCYFGVNLLLAGLHAYA